MPRGAVYEIHTYIGMHTIYHSYRGAGPLHWLLIGLVTLLVVGVPTKGISMQYYEQVNEICIHTSYLQATSITHVSVYNHSRGINLWTLFTSTSNSTWITSEIKKYSFRVLNFWIWTWMKSIFFSFWRQNNESFSDFQ